MPVLRAALALMAVFFAHFLGRAWARSRKGEKGTGRLIALVVRMTVALTAICFTGGLDWFAWIAFLLSAISLGAGFFSEWRPKHDDELTRTIFPQE